VAATALTNFAQVIMDLAIAINTTAFQPGMLDQTEQSLILLGARKILVRITTHSSRWDEPSASGKVVEWSLRPLDA